MDLRSVLYFWLNKPDSLDDWSSMESTRMRQGTYNPSIEEEFGHNSGFTTKRWGNPFGDIEAWIDIDCCIRLLNGTGVIQLYDYVKTVRDIPDWEKWPEPKKELKNALLKVLVNMV